MIYLVIWAWIQDCSLFWNFGVNCIPMKTPIAQHQLVSNLQAACELKNEHEGAYILRLSTIPGTTWIDGTIECKAIYVDPAFIPTPTPTPTPASGTIVIPDEGSLIIPMNFMYLGPTPTPNPMTFIIR